MDKQSVARELLTAARELTAFKVKLVALLDDNDKVIQKGGEAIEGEGIRGDDGKWYPAGFTAKGEVYADESDDDDSVLLEDGSRSKYKINKRYPRVVR